MSKAADDQHGNRLQVEKKLVIFFLVVALCIVKLAKTQIMAYSLFKDSRDIFLLVFYNYLVYDRRT